MDELFHRQRQGWNKGYKAAQMIYGPGPESIAARLAVSTQHKMMYSNIPAPETGYITNCTQFLDLLENGVIRKEPRSAGALSPTTAAAHPSLIPRPSRLSLKLRVHPRAGKSPGSQLDLPLFSFLP